MLFLVRMDVNIPHDLPVEQANEIKAREKAYSQELQRDGRWLHLWRVVGEYANYSVFDVSSNDELHQLLSQLPPDTAIPPELYVAVAEVIAFLLRTASAPRSAPDA